MNPRLLAGPLLIAVLIVIGLAMELSGLVDSGELLDLSRAHAQHWWLILLLILVPAILFSFALAGSLFLWVVAPLYSPLVASLILSAGACLGGLGAYALSGRLAGQWIKRIEISPSYKMLRRHGGFFTLLTLRLFPGFPHALVNYSAGILRLRPGKFALAALLGVFIKSYIYARVINAALDPSSPGLLFDPLVYGPLIALALLSLVALYYLRRLDD